MVMHFSRYQGTVKLTATLDSFPERFTLGLKTGLVE